MTAIEKLNAYCEAKGWSPVGDPALLLEVLDSGKILQEESSSRRWWNDLTRVVEVDGTLYQYETTGDESPSDKGWEFDPKSIGFVKATKIVETVTALKFEESDEPFSLEKDERPSYQTRVIEEKAALDEKIRKLRAFIDSPASDAANDCLLLIDQLASMDGYSVILGKRITGFDA